MKNLNLIIAKKFQSSFPQYNRFDRKKHPNNKITTNDKSKRYKKYKNILF